MRTVPRNPAIEAGSATGPSAHPGTGPVLAARPWLSRRALAALVAAVAAGGVAAGVVALVSGGSTAARPSTPPALVRIHGQPLQSANCDAWWRGTPAERAQAVPALHKIVAGSSAYGPAVTLSDSRAFRMFNRVCAPSFAGHFLLYEMYIRAAAFQPLGPGG